MWPKAAVAAWADMHVDHLSFAWAEDEAQACKCQEAILSGLYHAVVICDLCLRDLMEEPDCYFERVLGSRLRAFARAGVGAVAIQNVADPRLGPITLDAISPLLLPPAISN